MRDVCAVAVCHSSILDLQRHMKTDNAHSIKRDTREPDPSVVQSLNDKIQAWQLGRESTAAPLQPDIRSLQAVGP